MGRLMLLFGRSHEYEKDTMSQFDKYVVVSCNLEGKYPEHNSIMPLAVLGATPYMNGSICAFFHSSEITDGSGPMLHYAVGKKVSRGETTLSKVIPVHRKCIEWAPKVYYAGETIKNLDSEFLRAATLGSVFQLLNNYSFGIFCYAYVKQ